MEVSPGVTDAVKIAAIVAGTTIVSAVITGWQRRAEKKQEAEQRRLEKVEDYRRQDEVSDKVDAAAKQAATAASLLVESNKKVADTAKSQGAKLDQIHVLVNSNMTASMQGELDAYKSNLVLLEEISSLRKAAGQDPSPTTMAVIESTKKKIAELDAQLADRLKNTQKADEVRRIEGGLTPK